MLVHKIWDRDGGEIGYWARRVNVDAIMTADWRETRQEPSADLWFTAATKKIKLAAHIEFFTCVKANATCTSTAVKLWNKHISCKFLEDNWLWQIHKHNFNQ